MAITIQLPRTYIDRRNSIDWSLSDARARVTHNRDGILEQRKKILEPHRRNNTKLRISPDLADLLENDVGARVVVGINHHRLHFRSLHRVEYGLRMPTQRRKFRSDRVIEQHQRSEERPRRDGCAS